MNDHANRPSVRAFRVGAPTFGWRAPVGFCLIGAVALAIVDRSGTVAPAKDLASVAAVSVPLSPMSSNDGTARTNRSDVRTPPGLGPRRVQVQAAEQVLDCTPPSLQCPLPKSVAASPRRAYDNPSDHSNSPPDFSRTWRDRVRVAGTAKSGADAFLIGSQYAGAAAIGGENTWQRAAEVAVGAIRSDVLSMDVTMGLQDVRRPVTRRISLLRPRSFVLWEENSVATTQVRIGLLHDRLQYRGDQAFSEYGVSIESDFRRATRVRPNAPELELLTNPFVDVWEQRRSAMLLLDRTAIRLLGGRSPGRASSGSHYVEYVDDLAENASISVRGLYSASGSNYWRLVGGQDWWSGWQGRIVEAGGVAKLAAAKLDVHYNERSDDSFAQKEWVADADLGSFGMSATRGTLGTSNALAGGLGVQQPYSEYSLKISPEKLPRLHFGKSGVPQWIPTMVRLRWATQDEEGQLDARARSQDLRSSATSVNLSWTGDALSTDLYIMSRQRTAVVLGHRKTVGESWAANFSQSYSRRAWEAGFDIAAGQVQGFAPERTATDTYYSLGLFASVAPRNGPRISADVSFDRYSIEEADPRFAYWDEAWSLETRAEFTSWVRKQLDDSRAFLSLRGRIVAGQTFEGSQRERDFVASLILAFRHQL